VPPTGYGGIEWIVWLLADGLVDAGHDVTLFASGDSRTKAELVSVYDVAPSELIGTSIVEIHHCLACYERAGDFDVINDHSGLPAARSAAQWGHVPTVRRWTARRAVYEQEPRAAGGADLNLAQPATEARPAWVANCPNALDLSPTIERRGDSALPRLSRQGAHRAIEVARPPACP
jgi:hypothetical protein